MTVVLNPVSVWGLTLEVLHEVIVLGEVSGVEVGGHRIVPSGRMGRKDPSGRWGGILTVEISCSVDHSGFVDHGLHSDIGLDRAPQECLDKCHMKCSSQRRDLAGQMVKMISQ